MFNFFDEIDLNSVVTIGDETYQFTTAYCGEDELAMAILLDYERIMAMSMRAHLSIINDSNSVVLYDNIIKKTWDAIINFFKMIIRKIKKFFGWEKSSASKTKTVSESETKKIEKKANVKLDEKTSEKIDEIEREVRREVEEIEKKRLAEAEREEKEEEERLKIEEEREAEQHRKDQEAAKKEAERAADVFRRNQIEAEIEVREERLRERRKLIQVDAQDHKIKRDKKREKWKREKEEKIKEELMKARNSAQIAAAEEIVSEITNNNRVYMYFDWTGNEVSRTVMRFENLFGVISSATETIHSLRNSIDTLSAGEYTAVGGINMNMNLLYGSLSSEDPVKREVVLLNLSESEDYYRKQCDKVNTFREKAIRVAELLTKEAEDVTRKAEQYKRAQEHDEILIKNTEQLGRKITMMLSDITKFVKATKTFNEEGNRIIEYCARLRPAREILENAGIRRI